MFVFCLLMAHTHTHTNINMFALFSCIYFIFFYIFKLLLSPFFSSETLPYLTRLYKVSGLSQSELPEQSKYFGGAYSIEVQSEERRTENVTTLQVTDW